MVSLPVFPGSLKYFCDQTANASNDVFTRSGPLIACSSAMFSSQHAKVSRRAGYVLQCRCM